MSERSGVFYYDVARDGTLVYSPAPTQLPKRTLVWVGRNGHVSPASSLRRPFRDARLSPDGTRVAIALGTDRESRQVLVLELGRDTWTRVNPDGGTGGGVDAWLPDGERLLLTQITPEGLPALVLTRVDGAGTAELLSEEETAFFVAAAPDGRSLLLGRQAVAAQWDIWRLPLDGERTPQPWLVTPSLEMYPSFSPNGRFVAYQSDDSGRPEIYARPFAGGARHQVSGQGGIVPIWSRDGREIFFRSQSRLWTAPVRTTPTFSAGEPQELFEIPEEILGMGFDVALDGARFLMIQKDPVELRPIELVVVPDWLDEVRAKMAPAR